MIVGINGSVVFPARARSTSAGHDQGKGLDQAALKQQIRQFAETRAQYRDRCIHGVLKREGREIAGKPVYRLHRVMRLGLQPPPTRQPTNPPTREPMAVFQCQPRITRQ